MARTSLDGARTEGKTTLEDLGRGGNVPPAFAETVYDIVSPGTTVVVTDAPGIAPFALGSSRFSNGGGKAIIR
jgi:hypothetical protein